MFGISVKKWACTAFLGGAIAVSGSAWAQKSDEVIRWNLQSTWAPGLEIQRQIDEFAKKVEKMSNGR